MKKLNLKKKVVSVLTDRQMQSVEGGGTTSYTNCTGFLCCSPDCLPPPTEGVGQTCLGACGSTNPPASSLGQKRCLCIN